MKNTLCIYLLLVINETVDLMHHYVIFLLWTELFNIIAYCRTSVQAIHRNILYVPIHFNIKNQFNKNVAKSCLNGCICYSSYI